MINGKVSKNQVIATWAAFVLTATQRKYGIFGDNFLKIIGKYKVISFLINNYELLCYYDNDYVVEDIAKYVAEQGSDLNTVSL
jgi:hypothetical protein